jgi:hypothetical protein
MIIVWFNSTYGYSHFNYNYPFRLQFESLSLPHNLIFMKKIICLIFVFASLQNATSQIRRNYHPENQSFEAGISKYEKNSSYVQPASVLFTDDFDGANDTTSLISRGYLIYRNGTGPQGIAAIWFQGVPAGAGTFTFDAFNGPPYGYVASDYACAVQNNVIDNWLVLPALNVAPGDTFSFYIRAAADTFFVDSVKVMYNAAGDSVPGALTWIELDYFFVNENNWERRTYTAPVGSNIARWAIRYYIEDGGPWGSNSDYIGIDQIDVIPLSGVGISELTDHFRLMLHPNPARDFLNLRFVGRIFDTGRISVYDLQGRKMYEDVFTTPDNAWKQLDISFLKPGLYILELNNAKQSYYSKFIKE